MTSLTPSAAQPTAAAAAAPASGSGCDGLQGDMDWATFTAPLRGLSSSSLVVLEPDRNRLRRPTPANLRNRPICCWLADMDAAGAADDFAAEPGQSDNSENDWGCRRRCALPSGIAESNSGANLNDVDELATNSPRAAVAFQGAHKETHCCCCGCWCYHPFCKTGAN